MKEPIKISNYDYVMHSVYYLIAPTNSEELKKINDNEETRLKNIKEIIKENNIDINKVEGWTSFFSYAIFFRQEKIASYLLSIGADINYIDSVGLTPLNYLCTIIHLNEKKDISIDNNEISINNIHQKIKDKEMDNLLLEMLNKEEKLEIFYRRFNKEKHTYEPYLVYQTHNFGYNKIFDILTKKIRNIYDNVELYQHYRVEVHEFDEYNSTARQYINNVKKKEILLDYIMANDEQGAIDFLKNSKNPKKEIRLLDLDSQTVLHWAFYINYHSSDFRNMFRLIKLILEMDAQLLLKGESPIYAIESIRGLNTVHITMHFDYLKSQSLGKKYRISSLFLDKCLRDIDKYQGYFNPSKYVKNLNFNKIFNSFPIIDERLVKDEPNIIERENKLMYLEDLKTHLNMEKNLIKILEEEEQENNKQINGKKSKNAEKKARRKANLKANKLESENKKLLDLREKEQIDAQNQIKALELKHKEEQAKIEAEAKAKIEAEKIKLAKIEAKKIKKAEKKELKLKNSEAMNDLNNEKLKLEITNAKNEAIEAKNEAQLAKKEAEKFKLEVEKIKNDFENESSNSDITDSESFENSEYSDNSNSKKMYEEKLVEQQMVINAVQHEKICLQQMYHQQQVYQQQMFEQQMYQKQMYEQQMYMQQMYFQSQQNNYQPMTTPDGRLLQPTPTIFFD